MKKPGGDGSQALTAIYTCEILRPRVDLLNDIYPPGRTSLESGKKSKKQENQGYNKTAGTRVPLFEALQMDGAMGLGLDGRLFIERQALKRVLEYFMGWGWIIIFQSCEAIWGILSARFCWCSCYFLRVWTRKGTPPVLGQPAPGGVLDIVTILVAFSEGLLVTSHDLCFACLCANCLAVPQATD